MPEDKVNEVDIVPFERNNRKVRIELNFNTAHVCFVQVPIDGKGRIWRWVDFLEMRPLLAQGGCILLQIDSEMSSELMCWCVLTPELRIKRSNEERHRHHTPLTVQARLNDYSI
jgi:hypothetical protein